jgi:hypothetical protein
MGPGHVRPASGHARALLRAMLLTGGVWAASWVGPAASARETALSAQPETCDLWASVAAAEHGVPERLMHAITLVETRSRMSGRTGSWPWTVNVDGTGHWFATRARAETFVLSRLAEGVTNIDIGCFQLNHHWHGEAFATPGDMLDPARNARYAARFLAALHRELNDWTRATAAYHSRTPAHGAAYVARIAAALEDPSGSRTAAPREPQRSKAGLAAVPISPHPMPAAPGAPTGWTRAPSTASATGAPLGSLVPGPPRSAAGASTFVTP